ncbi:hypothetical protein P3L10_030285 [Capsicum annuum]
MFLINFCKDIVAGWLILTSFQFTSSEQPNPFFEDYSADAPVVEVFGSFSMDLFCAKSDLNLSVNFTNRKVNITREKKIQTLRKFAKKFYLLQSNL